MNSRAFLPPRPHGSTVLRVLMADPDESLQAAYRRPLLHEGFELVTAVSGLECAARLRERAPDALVLEPSLLWGGGDGILAMMGGIPTLATVPVLILTSCRDRHLLGTVAQFPVSDYQLKPLAPGRLAGRLRVMLAQPRLRFTLAEQTGRLECAIVRRTGGRIRDLHVESLNGRVIVHGRSDSHHVKQLALAAVREAFEASRSQSERVELDIEIAPNTGWQARRSALSERNYSNEPALTNELDLTREN